MERAVDLETNGPGGSHDNLTIGVCLSWLTLHVAKFNEALIQVNVLSLLLIE